MFFFFGKCARLGGTTIYNNIRPMAEMQPANPALSPPMLPCLQNCSLWFQDTPKKGVTLIRKWGSPSAPDTLNRTDFDRLPDQSNTYTSSEATPNRTDIDALEHPTRTKATPTRAPKPPQSETRLRTSAPPQSTLTTAWRRPPSPLSPPNRLGELQTATQTPIQHPQSDPLHPLADSSRT